MQQSPASRQSSEQWHLLSVSLFSPQRSFVHFHCSAETHIQQVKSNPTTAKYTQPIYCVYFSFSSVTLWVSLWTFVLYNEHPGNADVFTGAESMTQRGKTGSYSEGCKGHGSRDSSSCWEHSSRHICNLGPHRQRARNICSCRMFVGRLKDMKTFVRERHFISNKKRVDYKKTRIKCQHLNNEAHNLFPCVLCCLDFFFICPRL